MKIGKRKFYNRPYNIQTNNICKNWHSNWKNEIARVKPAFSARHIMAINLLEALKTKHQ